MLFKKVHVLVATTCIILLSSVFSAKADQCADAKKTFDKHTISTVNPFTDQLIKDLYPADRFESQKQSCETRRQMLADEKKSLELRRAVDRACGSRIDWKTCDTACAVKGLEKSEQETAYECDPARMTDIQKQIDAEKKKEHEENVSIEGCVEVISANKGDDAKPAWPSQIKSCNALDTDICNHAWLHLEEVGVSTAGLACPPSKEMRAEQKRISDENNSPEEVRKRDGMTACIDLMQDMLGDRRSLVEKCSAAETVYCEATKQQLNEDKKSTDGLICRAR
jgi:hypothetical protein